MEITTQSARETQNFGQKLAASLTGGETLALVGDLGAGKTTFVQGLAHGLGIKQRVTSPTFILLREYSGKKDLYHLDLYRLETDVVSEVENLGIEELWGKPKNIVVIEWAEKIKKILPPDTISINFVSLDEDKRQIKVEGIK